MPSGSGALVDPRSLGRVDGGAAGSIEGYGTRASPPALVPSAMTGLALGVEADEQALLKIDRPGRGVIAQNSDATLGVPIDLLLHPEWTVRKFMA